MSKLKNGDLESICLVEHENDSKRFIITGIFKGDKTEYTLARIGEGQNDFREPEVIKFFANSILQNIRENYSYMAYLKHKVYKEE